MGNPGMPLLSAAVLTGGQSRRMGADKALLMFDGSTLLERAITAVQSVSDDVFLVGDRAPYHRFGVPVLKDGYASMGPLGGIATALRAATHTHVLVVACDMPFLNPSLLGALANEPRDVDVLVPVVRTVSGELVYQALHAIYGKSCLPVVEARLASGRLRLTDIYAELSLRTYDEAWARVYDPSLESFWNVNTAQDLESARKGRRGWEAK